MPPRASKRAPRGQRQARKNPPRVSRVRWFGIGLLCGVMATLAVQLRLFTPEAWRTLAKATVGEGGDGGAAAGQAEPASAPGAGKPKFEFYTMLPEMEVAVPEAELEAPPPSPKPIAEGAPDEQGAGDDAKVDVAYLLQVGSFRKREQADRLKASLALIGLEAAIQTVAVNGAETWHRVRLGPFASTTSLNGARARLKEHNIQAMVLKTGG